MAKACLRAVGLACGMAGSVLILEPLVRAIGIRQVRDAHPEMFDPARARAAVEAAILVETLEGREVVSHG